MVASLFCLSEPEERIVIDDIGSRSIGLYDIRSKISIVPQDSFMLLDSPMNNLDSFGEYRAMMYYGIHRRIQNSKNCRESGLDSIMTE